MAMEEVAVAGSEEALAMGVCIPFILTPRDSGKVWNHLVFRIVVMARDEKRARAIAAEDFGSHWKDEIETRCVHLHDPGDQVEGVVCRDIEKISPNQSVPL
jgi:hypothetical protein